MAARVPALLAAAGLVAIAGCRAEGEADENAEAAGAVTPGATPDSLSATPSVPAGGQAGGTGTAGDNTGEPRTRPSADSSADSARHTPARVGRSGVGIRPPDTVHNPIPPTP